eukprot:1643207-Amphidinium_carterae.2
MLRTVVVVRGLPHVALSLTRGRLKVEQQLDDSVSECSAYISTALGLVQVSCPCILSDATSLKEALRKFISRVSSLHMPGVHTRRLRMLLQCLCIKKRQQHQPLFELRQLSLTTRTKAQFSRNPDGLSAANALFSTLWQVIEVRNKDTLSYIVQMRRTFRSPHYPHPLVEKMPALGVYVTG